MNKRSLFALVIFILSTEAVGMLGALATTPNIATWYAGLVKPMLTPPGWVFGPVWVTLYLLMGIAMFLVWRRRGIGSRRDWWLARIFYSVQLMLNLLWSIVFFGLHNSSGGLGVIATLWMLILLTIIFFGRVSRAAAWLLVPYIVWVSFAMYLNLGIWLCN